MSGHSKWSKIKRQKGATDASRGQLFTKLGREISVSVRQGGADPNGNFKLRLAIQRARDHNMPADNVERAIRRAAGGGDGAALAEVIYEGYGPNGTAIMLDVLTDNRNRTIADLRNIFSRGGGNLGEAGSVAWLFDQKGVISLEVRPDQAETIALEAIDAGAEDVRIEGGSLEIYTTPPALEPVRRSLEQKGIAIASAELAMLPKTTVQLDEKAALQTLKLLDRLEEMDDVQRVYSNADFSEDVLAKYQAQS